MAALPIREVTGQNTRFGTSTISSTDARQSSEEVNEAGNPMNYRGSYKRLLGNSKSAMVAAIEVYNKPSFKYRDECAVILLINAWELILKAVVSKAGKSIYYPKERNSPYRTLSWSDAFGQAQKIRPKELVLPVRQNLDLLSTFRNNAIHFYNDKHFGVVVHALAQTAILNYRDLINAAFGQKLDEEMNWQVMPIGIRPSVDIVHYLSGKSPTKMTSAVRQFLSELARSFDAVRDAGLEPLKLLTVFDVKMESVKKVSQADVVVGVTRSESGAGPLAVVRTQDPNTTHPLRQMDIVESIQELNERKFTQRTFQAIAWKFSLKDEQRFCWKASEGVLVRYSHDVVQFIRNRSRADVDSALEGYKEHLRLRRLGKA